MTENAHGATPPSSLCGETFWLIEIGQPEGRERAIWACESELGLPTPDGRQVEWTQDANEALRFATKADAEAVIASKRVPEPARAVEHAWFGGEE